MGYHVVPSSWIAGMECRRPKGGAMQATSSEDRSCEICCGRGHTHDQKCERCDGTGKSVLSEKDKIQVLLAEYSVLQTEIIHRMNNGFQVWGGGLVALGVMITLHNGNTPRRLFESFLIGVVVAIAFASWVTVRDQTKAVRRVKALEAEINWRAKERLLIHQTYLSAYDLSPWSFLFRAKPPKIQGLDRDGPKPPQFFYP
jgi:hypothetical protein